MKRRIEYELPIKSGYLTYEEWRRIHELKKDIPLPEPDMESDPIEVDLKLTMPGDLMEHFKHSLEVRWAETREYLIKEGPDCRYAKTDEEREKAIEEYQRILRNDQYEFSDEAVYRILKKHLMEHIQERVSHFWLNEKKGLIQDRIPPGEERAYDRRRLDNLSDKSHKKITLGDLGYSPSQEP